MAKPVKNVRSCVKDQRLMRGTDFPHFIKIDIAFDGNGSNWRAIHFFDGPIKANFWRRIN